MKDTRFSISVEAATYTELIRWADTAAATVGVPRIGIAEAVRAMIRGTLDDTAAAAAALQALRDARTGDQP